VVVEPAQRADPAAMQAIHDDIARAIGGDDSE
jgi:hypothetical protein